MTEPTHVGEARRAAAVMLGQTALDQTQTGAVAISINELGNNLVRYARGGQLLLRHDGLTFEVLALDRGPGLDVDLVMRDGFSTGDTPGTGLGAVRRLADDFDLFSHPNTGTAIVARFRTGIAKAKFTVSAVNVPYPGERVSGDGWVTRTKGAGHLGLMVVDGLGHGPTASQAAGEALDAFRRADDSNSPDRILQAIHARLKSTRGGAVFCFELDSEGIAYVGVGNVRAVLVRHGSTRGLISNNGTAGLQMRTFNARVESWNEANLLVVHSDGLGSRWSLDDYPGLLRKDPALIAGVLYRDFARGNDDATVVVVRRNA